MKKIFTFAAAVLASVAMMAQTTVFSATPVQEGASEVSYSAAGTYEITAAQATIFGGAVYACHNDGTSKRKFITKQSNYWAFTLDGSKGWFRVGLDAALQAGDTIMAVVLTNGAGSSNARGIWATTKDVVVRPSSAPACELLAESATEKEYLLVKYIVQANDDICGQDTLTIWRATGNGTYFKDFAIVRPAPTTTPVTSVNLQASATSTIVGRPVSLSASTDVLASEYSWKINDEVVEGAEAASFVFNPEAAGTYYLTAHARNEFNSGVWISSDAVEITVAEAQAELVVVDDNIVWNWDGAATANIEPADGELEYIFANASDKWVEDFAADKIAGKAQYFYYGSYKCFQGAYIKFITSVAGTITVEFSNTGTSDRPYRHLFVNGVDTELKSKNVDKVTLSNYAVSEGEVLLEGMMENAEVEGGFSANQLRFYKITFVKEGSETAINNTNAAVKATKVVRNGQLFIEKNGVVYNAQGAIVK